MMRRSGCFLVIDQTSEHVAGFLLRFGNKLFNSFLFLKILIN